MLNKEFKSFMNAEILNLWSQIRFDVVACLRESGERLTLAIASDFVAEQLDFIKDRSVNAKFPYSKHWKEYDAMSMKDQYKLIKNALKGNL